MPKIKTVVTVTAATIGCWIGLCIGWAMTEFGISVARWLLGCMSTTSGLLLLIAFGHVIWKKYFQNAD